jgi:flavin reductase
MDAIDTMTTERFRHAMSRLGAAVNVITTAGPAGRHGMTASAVCSVTDSPPTVLVCMNRRSGSHQCFRDNGNLCVNVLAGHHQALSTRFATPADAAARFDHDRWTELVTGAPVLADASAALDCRISQISDVGTHSVFFCEVVGVSMASQAGGLVWFDRAYHALGAG